MTFTVNHDTILIVNVTFMINIDNKLIANELIKQNPWWADKGVEIEEAKKPKREIYQMLKNKITESDLITAIIGMRRVGKTTLIKQVIADLLHHDIDKQTILYFSFEEFVLAQEPKFLEKTIQMRIDKYPKGKLYFFFDEIQYVDYWNAILKKFTDLYPQIKFIISGSSSLFIKTKARESLAGRISETIMRPFGFGEFLRIQHGVKFTKTAPFANISFERPEWEIEQLFKQYLAWGEFPYLLKLDAWKDKQEYLRSWVIGKVVEQDIPKYLRVVREAELVNLTRILTEKPGQLIELVNLSADLQLAKNTLSHYIDLLEKTLLVKQLFNWKMGFRTRNVRQRKIYPSSVNLSALQSASGIQEASWAPSESILAESFVANYLFQQSGEVYFWRKRAGQEIDFIWKTNQGLVPIEVKYQKQIRREDLKNLLYFCRQEKLNSAILVTRDIYKEKMTDNIMIKYIPAYYLL